MADTKTEKQKAKEITDRLEEGLKDLKSSLDVIRRTASELAADIEGQLEELWHNRELMQAQEKEGLLLVPGSGLSGYSLVNVRGMDSAKMAEALSSMNENDRLDVAAYLESRGARITEIANERTKEFGEHHPDARRSTGMGRITASGAETAETEPEEDVKEASGMERAESDPADTESYELPDPTITPSKMQEYGYTWEEMLPLKKEKALELFDSDLAVYLLHGDGSETMAEERRQIEGHEGIFGIEKGDWENERNFRAIQAEFAKSRAAKETQLLYGNIDKYGIYQLKDIPELRDFRFAGTAELLKRGLLSDDFRELWPENYNLVYVGELSDIDGHSQGERLEAVYVKFNIDRPAGYKGHSLSVSDIVVLHQDGGNSAHFVDSVGFAELPGFVRELEREKEQKEEKTENGLADEEKQFLETYNSSLFAKKFLAWDEIESLGYLFFEAGYIDRHKPTVKALYGEGMAPEPKIHDMARRMQGGGDVRKDLAKALMGDYDREIYIGENAAAAVFGRDAVTVILGNAKKQFSYEEMGAAFLGLMENEYRDIEQARAAEEQGEELAENAASGHDARKPAPEQPESEQAKTEKPEAQAGQTSPKQPEGQAEEKESEQDAETPDLEDMEDGDEMIDLGDETDQVLADMKKYLEDRQEASGHGAQRPEQAEAEETNRVEPQEQDVVKNFKARTNELFHEISEMSPAEIEEAVKCHVQAKIEEYGMDAEIIDAAVVGSRCRGLERKGSDLDVVVEISTEEREDTLFDTLNEDGLCIGGVNVDINPITAQRTGTLETYLPQAEEYLAGVREAREKEPVSLFSVRMNGGERWYKNASGLDVKGLCRAYAECGNPLADMEKHGERIKAADYDAMEHGERLAFSVRFDGETGRITVFDGEKFTGRAMREMLLLQRMEGEADAAAELAAGIVCLSHDCSFPLRHEGAGSMEEDASGIAGAIRQGDAGHLTVWLADIIGEGAVPEAMERAVVLLKDLNDYKPPAKDPEMETRDCSMADNAPGSGAGEKAGKDENKAGHGRAAARPSLKARLAKKQEIVSGRGNEPQEGREKNHKEI